MLSIQCFQHGWERIKIGLPFWSHLGIFTTYCILPVSVHSPFPFCATIPCRFSSLFRFTSSLNEFVEEPLLCRLSPAKKDNVPKRLTFPSHRGLSTANCIPPKMMNPGMVPSQNMVRHQPSTSLAGKPTSNAVMMPMHVPIWHKLPNVPRYLVGAICEYPNAKIVSF